MKAESGIFIPEADRRFSRRQVLGGALGTAGLTFFGRPSETQANTTTAPDSANTEEAVPFTLVEYSLQQIPFTLQVPDDWNPAPQLAPDFFLGKIHSGTQTLFWTEVDEIPQEMTAKEYLEKNILVKLHTEQTLSEFEHQQAPSGKTGVVAGFNEGWLSSANITQNSEVRGEPSYYRANFGFLFGDKAISFNLKISSDPRDALEFTKFTTAVNSCAPLEDL